MALAVFRQIRHALVNLNPAEVRAEADPLVVKGLELMPQAKALAENAKKIVAEHNAAPAFNR